MNLRSTTAAATVAPSRAAVDDQLRQTWRHQLENEWRLTWEQLDQEAVPRHEQDVEAITPTSKDPAVAPPLLNIARREDHHAVAPVAPRQLGTTSTYAPQATPNDTHEANAQSADAPMLTRIGSLRDTEIQDDIHLANADPHTTVPLGLAGTCVPKGRPLSVAETGPDDSAGARTGTSYPANVHAGKSGVSTPQPLFRIRDMESGVISASLRDTNLDSSVSADVARSLSYALMRIGYSQAQVYVNGSESRRRMAEHGPSAEDKPPISQKEPLHGD